MAGFGKLLGGASSIVRHAEQALAKPGVAGKVGGAAESGTPGVGEKIGAWIGKNPIKATLATSVGIGVISGETTHAINDTVSHFTGGHAKAPPAASSAPGGYSAAAAANAAIANIQANTEQRFIASALQPPPSPF